MARCLAPRAVSGFFPRSLKLLRLLLFPLLLQAVLPASFAYVSGPSILTSNQPTFPGDDGAAVTDVGDIVYSAAQLSSAGVEVVFFVDNGLNLQKLQESDYKPFLDTIRNHSKDGRLFSREYRLTSGHLTDGEAEALGIKKRPLSKADSMSIVDISSAAKPRGEVILDFIRDREKTSQKFLIALTSEFIASPTPRSAVARQLAPGPAAPAATIPEYIDMSSVLIAGIIYSIIFALIIALGIGCLMSVDCPVAFEDRTLVINKEY